MSSTPTFVEKTVGTVVLSTVCGLCVTLLGLFTYREVKREMQEENCHRRAGYFVTGVAVVSGAVGATVTYMSKK